MQSRENFKQRHHGRLQGQHAAGWGSDEVVRRVASSARSFEITRVFAFARAFTHFRDCTMSSSWPHKGSFTAYRASIGFRDWKNVAVIGVFTALSAFVDFRECLQGFRGLQRMRQRPIRQTCSELGLDLQPRQYPQLSAPQLPQVGRPINARAKVSALASCKSECRDKELPKPSRRVSNAARE